MNRDRPEAGSDETRCLSLSPCVLRRYTRASLSPYRARHVLGTETVAAALAHHWGVSERAAREAALLHDITKEAKHRLIFVKSCGILRDKHHQRATHFTPRGPHAESAARLAARLGASRRVMAAIRCHTHGKPFMRRLSKLLFVADLAEPQRSRFDGLDELRRVMWEDLDRAFLLGLEIKRRHVLATGKTLHPGTDALIARQQKRVRQKEAGLR